MLRSTRNPTVGVTLEIEDDVDHVLEQLGPGKAALLGHVTDKDHCGAGRLGQPHQTAGALSHLGQTAGRRWDLGHRDCLDRIHDQETGTLSLDQGHDGVDIVVSDQGDHLVADPEPAGPDRHLLGRFLGAGNHDRKPLCATAPAVWSSNVDLPTPGSPPRRRTDPGTKPPPRTRSTSGQPVGSLSAGPSAASVRVTVRAGATEAAGRVWSSTKGVVHPALGTESHPFRGDMPARFTSKGHSGHRIRLPIATSRRENERRHQAYDKDDPGQ